MYPYFITKPSITKLYLACCGAGIIPALDTIIRRSALGPEQFVKPLGEFLAKAQAAPHVILRVPILVGVGMPAYFCGEQPASNPGSGRSQAAARARAMAAAMSGAG